MRHGLWIEARGQQEQSNDPGNNQHILNTLFYGALDSHPFFPSHVVSGCGFLSAAAAGALAGVFSAFAEPGNCCVGAVLDVAWCAVYASAAPNNWPTTRRNVTQGITPPPLLFPTKVTTVGKTGVIDFGNVGHHDGLGKPPGFFQAAETSENLHYAYQQNPPFFRSHELGGGVDNGKPLIRDPVFTLAILLCVMSHMHFRISR